MLHARGPSQADQITALMAACMAGFTDIALALLAHPDIDVNAKKKGDVRIKITLQISALTRYPIKSCD